MMDIDTYMNTQTHTHQDGGGGGGGGGGGRRDREGEGEEKRERREGGRKEVAKLMVKEWTDSRRQEGMMDS